MKLPQNITQESFLLATERVMEIVKGKFLNNKFYDPDDISQEVFLICSTAVFKYTPDKGRLENYLCRSAINGIQNKIRNLSRSTHETENVHDCEEPVEKIVNMKTSKAEFFDVMDESLPSRFREDYLKVLHDVQIPRVRKKNLIAKIKEVINDCF